MSDRSTTRRAVLGAGTLAGSTFALMAIAGPASAIGLPPLPPAPVPAPAPPAIIQTCGVTVRTNCYLPGTTTFVKFYAPPAPPLPPAPAPVSSAIGGATAPLQAPAGQVQSAVGGATGAVGGAGAAVGGVGGTPGTPTTGGAPAGGSSAGTTGAGGSAPGSAPATAKAQGATADNLLGAASAFLPTSLFTTVADLGSTPGSLESVPSPDLAALPQSRLQDVQAPVLAAAEQSADGSIWRAITGKALPGLLIVLATVVVGLVGAGNIRVWQLRTAARHG